MNLPFSFYHEDSRNYVFSSEFIHLRQQVTTVFFCTVFGQKEGWGLLSTSELSGTVLSCSVLRYYSRIAVGSLKSIHMRQNGATVCFWTVLIKTRDGDSSLSRKYMEKTSLSHFTMWIQEMWFFLQNSSICVKKQPPCFSALFWAKGRMETLLYLGNAWKEPRFLILPWGSKKCGWFLKIHPFASKWSHRVFLHCFSQKEGWRHLSTSEFRGNILSCSVFHEDSRNVVSSLKFIHCVKMEPPCVSGLSWSKRSMGTLLLHLGNGWK